MAAASEWEEEGRGRSGRDVDGAAEPSSPSRADELLRCRGRPPPSPCGEWRRDGARGERRQRRVGRAPAADPQPEARAAGGQRDPVPQLHVALLLPRYRPAPARCARRRLPLPCAKTGCPPSRPGLGEVFAPPSPLAALGQRGTRGQHRSCTWTQVQAGPRPSAGAHRPRVGGGRAGRAGPRAACRRPGAERPPRLSLLGRCPPLCVRADRGHPARGHPAGRPAPAPLLPRLLFLSLFRPVAGSPSSWAPQSRSELVRTPGKLDAPRTLQAARRQDIPGGGNKGVEGCAQFSGES